MIYCQNCGKENPLGTNFCRYCGHQFSLAETQKLPNDEYNPPRPYMWKTDEFQVRQHSARKTQEIQDVQPLLPPVYAHGEQQRLIQQQPAFMATGFRCPRCGTTRPPFLRRQISTAGWITFAVLLVTTFIFFWIGLLLKEDVQVCSVCGCRISLH